MPALSDVQRECLADPATHNRIGSEFLASIGDEPSLIGAGAFADEDGSPILLVLTTPDCEMVFHGEFQGLPVMHGTQERPVIQQPQDADS